MEWTVVDFETDPWERAYESNCWHQRLAAIGAVCRTSMEAAVVERALPLYLTWAESHHPRGAALAREGLQILWNSVGSRYDRALAPIAAEYMLEHDLGDRCRPPGVYSSFEALRFALRHVDHTGLSWENTCLDEAYHSTAAVVSQHAKSRPERYAILDRDPRVRADLAFQETVLSEIERIGEPIARVRAAELSRAIDRLYLGRA